MIEGIVIRQLPAKESASGKTIEWCRGVPGIQVTFGVKEAGTLSGNHYHLGEDPSKDPERFILVSGEGIFLACDGQRTSEVLLTPFMEVLISPWIVHALYATTPIMFAEYRQTIYDPERSDGYRAESYAEQLSHSGRPIDPTAITSYFERVKEFFRRSVT